MIDLIKVLLRVLKSRSAFWMFVVILCLVLTTASQITTLTLLVLMVLGKI
ncbi:hypothetical protein F7734_00120 [Scytonema sp. UIC 10036]|nr:hypothetical protein [Scytonema sp. UIC 10036]MUG90998.1 hypothetical protein [Scytonema sp. UIC 10036]